MFFVKCKEVTAKESIPQQCYRIQEIVLGHELPNPVQWSTDMIDQDRQTVEVPAESLPVIARADVVVVGGGTAGFIAATAAARTGANTVLVERYGYLGGCLTTTYNTTPGRFYDKEGRKVIGGIPWEYVERMQQEGEAFVLPGREAMPQIWPPTTKKVALDMIEEAGVELYFYTWASGIVGRNGKIEGIVVQSKGGRAVILGTTFVDASADADIAAWAGAPYEMADVDDLQQVSLDLTACGVDAARVIAWVRDNQGSLDNVRGLDSPHQELGPQPMFSFVVPSPSGPVADGQDYPEHHVGVMPTVKLCVYRDAVRLQGSVVIDPLDPKALTYAETEGLRGAYRHLAYLKETVPGFEGAYIVAQHHLGVRESRRIIGEYILTLEDLLGQARFDDVVALNCRALDYHLKGDVFKWSLFDGHHDIPLRALLPRNVDNLLVAGRCVSSNHLAHASVRGSATCMATGHAAGTAAALAAAGGGCVRAVDIRRIQDTLREQGAILSGVSPARSTISSRA
jgi:hypothetical protein